jgi:hypothetical protein
VYWGRFEQEGERLPSADRVQYILVPVNLGADADVLDGIRGEFTVAYAEHGVQLLVRRA